MITTLWSSMIKLCQLRGVTEWQDQQLRWYIDKWSSVCSDLSKLSVILDLGEVKKDMAEAVGLESDEKELRKNYPLFPVNWGVENVIVIPIRHCLIADGDVNEMEKNAMAHFFENFGEIGEMAELEWDITDDQIMQIHSEGKYEELLADSAIFLKENLDEDQLSKLIWYMATIVSVDGVIKYTEFVTLKFYFDRWYPDALDIYIEKFKNAGIMINTSPDK
jgi:uncharacterized tellurite resistance protein B-like protein